MSRPRTIPETPEQSERRRRLDDAIRRLDMPRTRFCAQHGFTSESLWRWTRRGDPERPPRNGGTITTTESIAAALGVDAAYLRPGGPRLWAEPGVPGARRPHVEFYARGAAPSGEERTSAPGPRAAVLARARAIAAELGEGASVALLRVESGRAGADVVASWRVVDGGLRPATA